MEHSTWSSQKIVHWWLQKGHVSLLTFHWSYLATLTTQNRGIQSYHIARWRTSNIQWTVLMPPFTPCLCLLTAISPVQNSFQRAFQLQSISLTAIYDTKMNLLKGFPSSRGDKIYTEYKIKMSKASKKQQSSMRVWRKVVLATGHLIWGSDIWEGLCRTSENWMWDVQAAGTMWVGAEK